MQEAYCPHGHLIIGSYEKVYGCALGDVTREGEGFGPEIEYGGETKIWWDTQKQVTEAPPNASVSEMIGAEKLWVCDKDDIWKTSELVWKECLAGVLDELKKRGIEGEQLDEVVHDLKSEEASLINNSGIDSQVKYILDRMDQEELLDMFDNPKEEG